MRRIFDIESPLMGFLFKVFDCVCLSLLWFGFSLPIVTMGAASTALYAAALKCLERDESYLLKTFWKAFRENFTQSTLCWLVILAVLALLTVDAAVFRAMLAAGEGFGKLYWVILILFCVAATWAVYVTAYCARCNGSVKEVLRISFLLMLLHPIRALTVFVPCLGGAVLALMAPGLMLLLPAPLCWLSSKTIEQVLRLHMRPEDLDKACGNGV